MEREIILIFMVIFCNPASKARTCTYRRWPSGMYPEKETEISLFKGVNPAVSPITDYRILVTSESDTHQVGKTGGIFTTPRGEVAADGHVVRGRSRTTAASRGCYLVWWRVTCRLVRRCARGGKMEKGRQTWQKLDFQLAGIRNQNYAFWRAIVKCQFQDSSNGQTTVNNVR